MFSLYRTIYGFLFWEGKIAMDTMVYEKKTDPDVKNIKTQFLFAVAFIVQIFGYFLIE